MSRDDRTTTGDPAVSRPVTVAILTASDLASRGERADASGDAIASWCRKRGYRVVARATVPDETAAIVPVLLDWSDRLDADLILTTGGTGFTARDVTPEATRAVIEREAPGLAEALRARGALETPYSNLSRGVAGLRGGTTIVNFPGGTGGVRDGLEVLDPAIDHAVELARGTSASHAPRIPPDP